MTSMEENKNKNIEMNAKKLLMILY